MHEIYQRIITGLFLSALVIATLFYAPPWAFALVTLSFLGIILTTEWPRLFNYKKAPFWLIMPFYPILPFILVISMQLTGYEILNRVLIASVALYDTASYLIGTLVGRHKISVLISPGKTWEGCLGGILLTTLITFLSISRTSPVEITWPIIPLTVGICLCALAGDLFESFLKRRAGIKDSGTFLPGHGGILDRVDGMMFVAVVIYLFRNYLHSLLTYTS
ncbi:CDP-archaeol synthase [Candidatus Dependentiae bacterium]|nr:CDP-archaeol synthase [Candidatus Dependentiae bacterium]